VGKTFSSLAARALRSKGFSVLDIKATTFPLRNRRWLSWPVSSLASPMHRAMLSGFMPTSVPTNFLPVVVLTVTSLSTSDAISEVSFLCAPTDTFYISSVFA